MRLTSGGDAIKPEQTYKDYRFVVSKVGKGWRAMIYAPRSTAALRESPTNLEESSKQALAEAKWIGCTMLARADEMIG